MSEAKAIPVIPLHRPGKEVGNPREEVRDLIEQIVKRMVNVPESVHVTYSVGDKTTVFKIDCCQEAFGRLVGAKGKNICGLRAIVAAMMAMEGVRAVIDIPYFAPGRR